MLSLEQLLILASIVAIPAIAGYLITRSVDAATTTLMARRHARLRAALAAIPDGEDEEGRP